MKKIFLLFCLILSFSFSALFAQSASLIAANKKTAQRCLNLAEKYIISNEWQNALNQAELGLAYDDSISDLLYVKAAAEIKLGIPRGQVLETINQAFKNNNWVNYNKNSARILAADVYSDIGLYYQSQQMLNEEPFLYSADAEFIRIKNNYRMGTEDSIAQARSILNNSRKIYPTDERFPQIFFIFEALFMNYAQRNNIAYEIPEVVKKIADSYIVKFPDYSKTDFEMEIRALMFAEPEQQQRLLRAIGEINQDNPLFALAGLKTGILSEEKAYNIFFSSAKDKFYLYDLESFGLFLKDPALKENFRKYIDSFTGTLIIDEDLDLRNELIVTYERGRPSSIKYDENNDQINELYSVCDFGTPLSINFNKAKVDLFYDIFPAVGKVFENNSNTTFYFLNDDYSYNPFDVVADKIFKSYDVDFYIPYIRKDFRIPNELELSKYASAVEVPTQERPNSKVVYTIFEGRPVFAAFTDTVKKYAYCTIEPGVPFVRYVDYDNDNIYETAETYDIDGEHKYWNEEDSILIQNIFGKNIFTMYLYLKKVEIDRDSDTIAEYREEYLENKGCICSWDDDSNGVIDYQYIRYPLEEAQDLKEVTVFYNSSGIEYISLMNINSKPFSMTYNGQEIAVTKGIDDRLYWIGEKGTTAQETTVLQSIKSGLTNGVVQLIGYDDNLRIAVIRIDGFYYCRMLPPGEIIENAEYVNE